MEKTVFSSIFALNSKKEGLFFSWVPVYSKYVFKNFLKKLDVY